CRDGCSGIDGEPPSIDRRYQLSRSLLQNSASSSDGHNTDVDHLRSSFSSSTIWYMTPRNSIGNTRGNHAPPARGEMPPAKVFSKNEGKRIVAGKFDEFRLDLQFAACPGSMAAVQNRTIQKYNRIKRAIRLDARLQFREFTRPHLRQNLGDLVDLHVTSSSPSIDATICLPSSDFTDTTCGKPGILISGTHAR